MILLFDDFGWHGPYVGQVKIALATRAPGVPVIDLMHDAPSFQPKAAAYFLAALMAHAPPDAVVVAVVDPLVGGARLPFRETDASRPHAGDRSVPAPIGKRVEREHSTFNAQRWIRRG